MLLSDADILLLVLILMSSTGNEAPITPLGDHWEQSKPPDNFGDISLRSALFKKYLKENCP